MKIVAIKNPSNGKIFMRRVIALPNQWVRRGDDGGLIQVPNEHVWVESENHADRGDDSLTKYGPVTRKLIVGEVKWVFY